VGGVAAVVVKRYLVRAGRRQVPLFGLVFQRTFLHGKDMHFGVVCKILFGYRMLRYKDEPCRIFGRRQEPTAQLALTFLRHPATNGGLTRFV